MPGKLTTHLLDTATGRPAAGVLIELFRRDGLMRVPLNDVVTNADGRADAPLLEGEAMLAGTYELLFHVGDYFGEKSFLDAVPVVFVVSSPAAHYHVPLLCSPFGYTTYRGS